jgi:hypothetical protein
MFEIGSNGPLAEIQEGSEGEAISSRGGFASLHKSGSMRSFLDAGSNRERERAWEGRSSESHTGSLEKVQSWSNLGTFVRARILK